MIVFPKGDGLQHELRTADLAGPIGLRTISLNSDGYFILV